MSVFGKELHEFVRLWTAKAGDEVIAFRGHAHGAAGAVTAFLGIEVVVPIILQRGIVKRGIDKVVAGKIARGPQFIGKRYQSGPLGSSGTGPSHLEPASLPRYAVRVVNRDPRGRVGVVGHVRVASVAKSVGN